MQGKMVEGFGGKCCTLVSGGVSDRGGGSLKPSDLKMKKIEKKTCFLLNRPAITALRLVFNSDHFDVSCRKKTVRAPSFLWPICHVLTTPGTRDAGYDKSSS